MAGLLGVTSLGQPSTALLAERLESAGQALRHSDRLGFKSLGGTDNLAIGAVFHSRNPTSVDAACGTRFSVYLYGEMAVSANDNLDCTAARLLQELDRSGIATLDHLSGSYQLVVVDRTENRMFLQNDRQASLPLCYAWDAGWFCFSPEGKGIFRLSELTPELDVEAGVCFLREGFPLTHQTMFHRIFRLLPGHRAIVDWTTQNVEIAEYWRLVFRPRVQPKLTVAVDEMFQLILSSHCRVTQDFPQNFGVFLTGGIDSRGIAASLDRIERRPAAALTWCGEESVPDSDATIAPAIARHFGVPHQNVLLRSSAFESHARNWLYVSELLTDNMGFFLAPYDVLNTLELDSIRFLLVGDELFGHGCDSGTTAAAEQYVLKSAGRPADRWLRGCIRPSASERNGEFFQESMRKLVGRTEEHNPRDLVDYLTYYVYRPCWSYSAGNCKEPAIPVRRPYMQDAIIEYIAAMDGHFRNDKMLYYEVLKRRLPETRLFPRVTGSSLFDWPFEFRSNQKTRQLLLHGVGQPLLDGPMSEVLDCDAVRRATDRFFADQPSARRETTYGHYAVNFRRWTGKLPVIGKAVQRLSRQFVRSKVPTSIRPIDLVRRLALLGLFVEMLESGRYSAQS